ncbi:MAG: OmpA family protein [Saprospiraceae bacterium]|nr:OmpA family protein [Saprospiraceae bacterium]MBP7679553.1 OmpA family protein [Saprospiraceae bacterium]
MVSKHILLGLILISTKIILSAQTRQPNLVANPSFEYFADPPIGWFYKGEHFTKVMKYWHSPTSSSPDAYGPKVRVPIQWANKGFGDQKPHSGTAMVGLTLYGCQFGKPHCREYIQIQLSEPLVVGQNYALSFWVSHLPRSLRINNIGAAFSVNKIDIKTDALLTLLPQVYAHQPIDVLPHKWHQLSGEFVADAEANYLIIGNFFSDSLTTALGGLSNQLDYAYYYIDDVTLVKKEPILPIPVKDDDLTKIPLAKGKVIPLKNIFFDTNSADLLPRSFIELHKLESIMQAKPSMVIEIRGHTDNEGSDNYNKDLSRRRAKSVMEYLVEHDIPRTRIRYIGYGETKPIATNNTPKGRQQNRRVEFLIVKE